MMQTPPRSLLAQAGCAAALRLMGYRLEPLGACGAVN
jgi:hypothetical protein